MGTDGALVCGGLRRANRGYAVLQINYRGSTGYGKEVLQASFRERGGKMSSDLVDGKRWAVQQGYADPKRTCMYGVSYGAYAVLVALAFTPDEFVCGVEAYGASNLITLLKSFPPYWALYRLQWERRVGMAEEQEFLKSRSPIFKVQEIKSPLLIGQGVNDPRVVKAESDSNGRGLAPQPQRSRVPSIPRWRTWIPPTGESYQVVCSDRVVPGEAPRRPKRAAWARGRLEITRAIVP
jgi:dienelactone hydrolase